MDSAIVSRRRILVTGIVQGVGFRPFVHRLAREYGLTGFVRNTGDGVAIEVEGATADIDRLIHAIGAEAPPLARVAQISFADLPPQHTHTFEIIESVPTGGRSWLAPDVGLCNACRRELQDPADRRFRHPFITCTDCGPRYTIIHSLPYDRPATTMASFAMCGRCRDDYQAPDGRRFHAEPVACLECGPRLWLVDASGEPGARVDGAEALARTRQVIEAGGIVAVKGVGGFHLICDAANAVAVETLRRRKQRPHKPFAIVAADLDRARRVAYMSPEATRALESPARPIVLLDRRADSGLAAPVAPGLRQVGVMLPHSPLHELIVRDWTARADALHAGGSAALVMTSGNRSEEPVVIDNDEARVRLADLADALLLHDRRILMRCDDSVMADNGTRPPAPIRRSRGQSPAPVPLPHAERPILAVGGEVKATFCLAVDGQAILSPHIGDMENVETLEAFSAAVDHLCRVFGVEPEIYVCDAHPGYLSARWAEQAAGGRLVRVQHHHAHAASLMAEHDLGLDDELLTFCFDGTGYGPDGAIWGGEVLAARYLDFRRVAHLAYAPLPGGDSAVRHVSRLALAYLERAGVPWAYALAPARACRSAEQRMLTEQLKSGVGVVPTSSMGRLFDVVSAMAGVCQLTSYEGQAAMELEAAADDATSPGRSYHFPWDKTNDGVIVIDWRPVIRAVTADAADGVSAPLISAAFHDAVADLVAGLTHRLLRADGIRRVGLTGGVFQNRRLLRLTVDRLEAQGTEVLTHRVVPPNDGGLSLGQAAIGAARLHQPDRN